MIIQWENVLKIIQKQPNILWIMYKKSFGRIICHLYFLILVRINKSDTNTHSKRNWFIFNWTTNHWVPSLQLAQKLRPLEIETHIFDTLLFINRNKCIETDSMKEGAFRRNIKISAKETYYVIFTFILWTQNLFAVFVWFIFSLVSPLMLFTFVHLKTKGLYD